MGKKSIDSNLLRTEAEVQLHHAPATELVIRPAEELLHELQTHQIELEMQNEELQRAHIALEVSRDRYLQLYDFAPVAYLTLSKNELITEANQTCATLFGVERKKLINSRFACYVALEDGDCWYRYFRQAKRQGGKQNYELTLLRADGTHFYAHLDCLHSEKDNEPMMMLRITIVDITERKQAEEALRIAAVAFETHDGIIVTDVHKLILRANRAFCHITGYSIEEVIGYTPSFLHSGLHDEDFYKAIWTSVACDGHWQGEIWDMCKEGKISPLWLTINAVTDPNGFITHYVGAFTDITVLKKAEEILLDTRQRLERQVTTSQMELAKNKEESQKINTTLNVLLRHQQTDRYETQCTISHQVNKTILPFLEKLKKASTNTNQTNLLNILENNLEHLVKTYGRASTLSSTYQLLTPVEIQVASMVRQGLSTKKIATTLLISSGTVSIHRKHIRKKLELNGKTTNLSSYLMSLTE